MFRADPVVQRIPLGDTAVIRSWAVRDQAVPLPMLQRFYRMFLE